MTRPPTFAELADWVEGRMDPERARVVGELVRTDDETRRTAEWIDGFLHAARLMPLVDPDPALLDRLRGLFDAPAAGWATGSWVSARLLYDTAVVGMAGVRLDVGPGERHLAFESEVGRFVVEVCATGVEAYVDLSGLLMLDEMEAGSEVSVLENGAVRKVVYVDPAGAFRVADVPVGVDEIRIVAGSRQIRARVDLLPS